MKGIWTQAPALSAAVALCLGISIGFYLSPGYEWICVTAISALTGSIIYFRFKKQRGLILAALMLTAGLILGKTSAHPILPHELEDARGTLTGKIVKTTRTQETIRVVVEGEKWVEKTDSTFRERPLDFSVLCIIRGYDDELIPGASLTVSGKMHDVRYEPDVPYETDYNRYLYIDGIAGRMTVYNKDDYTVDKSAVGSFQRIVNDWRREWLCAITNAGFNEETTSFLLAVIGGDDLLLSDDMEEQFRATGLSHILAISGMHVGIILVLLSVLLYPLRLIRRLRPFYFILLGIFIVVYAFVAGGSPSACRAAAMCCIILGDRILETRSNPLQSLSVAVIIILCVRPLWLFLPGFQFSVCAVFSIICFMPILNLIPQNYKILRMIWGVAVLPVIAVAGTLILTVFYFHSFALNFWCANILTAVFIPFIIGIGFLCTLAAMVGLRCDILNSAGDFIFKTLSDSVSKIAGWFPDSKIAVFLDDYSLIAIGLGLAVMAWLAWNYTHKRGIIVLALMSGVIFILPISSETLPEAELYIPRHYDRTNIMIVQNGKSYVWTTARDSLNMNMTREKVAKQYIDFYRHRKTNKIPEFLNDNDILKNNIISFGNKTLARIDNDSSVTRGTHVNLAIVSELYSGEMYDLVKTIKADSILLSPAINYSRHNKFVRQLDTLDVKYRSLRDKPLVWQIHKE